MTTLLRETRETRIELALCRRGETIDASLDGIATGDRFLDHMLGTLARYADLELRVRAQGDLRHHLVEDVGIALGQALRAALPPACARYGGALAPMDEALVQV